MKSNSNLVITGYSVNPVSQQITSLEVNGTPVSSSADLDDNKAATINVSTYTQPVEVTPTSGKDGMKKATITLSNIPSGVPNTTYGSSLECDGDDTAYVVTDKADFTQASFFLFVLYDSSSVVSPVNALSKIEPTSITSNSFVYEGTTWTVRAN